MPGRLSAVPRLVFGSVSTALCTLSLTVYAGKPTPPPEPPPPPPGVTVRVSVTAAGMQANNSSYNPVMTPDGRYVVFVSTATNLVPGDTNGQADVFVHDRATGAVERVNVASDGTQANNWSYDVAISTDGRYVAFESYATNLVPGEQHYYSHVYLHDRVTHITERVSLTSDGTPANSYSYRPAVSADGRYVAFSSYGTNLVAGDTNADLDVFVRDRATGVTERVSVAANGTQGNGRSHGHSISPDGRYVSYLSDASNLVAGDTNGQTDVFLYDRQTHTPERISVGTGGVQASGYSTGGAMTADARWVLFSSDATNLAAGDTNNYIDAFVRDRVTGVTERVSVTSTGAQANWGDSYSSSISADGNVVAFTSYADNLAPTDANYYYGDVFVRIRSTGTTEHISISSNGTSSNDENGFGTPTVSADGRLVSFDSYASNLVADDTNGVEDVFVRERYSSP